MEETSEPHVNTHDPSIHKMLIRQYDKHGKDFVYREYGVSDRTIRRWKSLLREVGSLGNRYAAGAKRSSLSPQEMTRLERELIKSPHATNTELAAEIKNKIKSRAVGKGLAKSKHQFVWKLEGLDDEETFNADVGAETKKFFTKVKSTPRVNIYMSTKHLLHRELSEGKVDFPRAKNRGLRGTENTPEWSSSVL